MRILSIKEFSEYCVENNDACYVFSSDNQDYVPGTIHISLRFNKVLVTLHPNTISMYGEMSVITMGNVKRVQIHDDVQSIGIRLDVICAKDNKDFVYTFLID